MTRQTTARRANLQFLKPLKLFNHEKPYEIWSTDVENISLKRTNCEFEDPSAVVARDGRHVDQLFSLEKNGFKYLHNPLKNELDMSKILSESGVQLVEDYLNIVVEQVRLELNAVLVICHDWRYRSSADNPRTSESANRFNVLKTANVVHIDDSSQGGLMRVQALLGDAAFEDYLASGMQIRIINVWRPLVKEVKTHPLILCDWTSVCSSDVEVYDKVHSDHIQEGCYIYKNPNHDWYWLSNQTNDEVAMFVTWDSEREGKVTGCPHGAVSSFQDNLDQVDEPRESIEVRLVVVSPKTNPERSGELVEITANSR